MLATNILVHAVPREREEGKIWILMPMNYMTFILKIVQENLYKFVKTF